LTCDQTNNIFCLQCNTEKGYYPNDDSNQFCYNNETIMQNYYLDKSESLYKWKKCYEKCETCYSQGDSINMNCLSCKTNLGNNISFELVDGNCINKCLDNTFITPEGDCVLTCPKGTYQYSLNNSCLYSCPKDYVINNNECVINLIDNEITIEEFKNQISNNITSYVNSTKIINGSNFLAVVLSSDDINPEQQIKNGISAFDLGNCTNVLKEHYDIPENENLIIMNMEITNDKIKKNESDSNDDKSFILGKSTQLEVYDYSGRKLNLSVCKEDITIMKFIGDIKELNIDSAKTFSEKGIDVFNASHDFFNDLCYHYDNKDGKDIIINDRRNDIYQNASFCQSGCNYNGMNYDLMVANCICNPSIFQEDEKNMTNINENLEYINFKLLGKEFLENLVDLNYKVMRCYNLVLNKKIIFYNIGFYVQISMLFLQIIFVFIYLIKRLNSLKHFMLKFDDKNSNKNKSNKKINIVNNKHHKNHYIKRDSKKEFLATPPPKFNKIGKSSNNLMEKKNLLIADIHNNSKKLIFKKNLNMNEESNNKLNKKSSTKSNLQKNLLISNNLQNNIHIHNIYNNNHFEEMNNLNNHKRNINIKDKDSKYENKNNNNLHHNIIKINKEDIAHMKDSKELLKAIYDLQDMDYEEAILYDKRGYLKMYLGFLLDSQIILGTFCTDNHLDLFIIKLSFLICTFQISFFLNALFYSDEYISNAYHNDGVLDFFAGLPKSIYSLVATLLTTTILRMLSNSKSELMNLIKGKRKNNNYALLIHLKLIKLGKKLVFYFILVYIFSLFFLYYVAAFCAVYPNSQKYWFYGCLESFGIDSLYSFGACIFLAIFRYISIKKHIKCFFILANIISNFL